MTNKSVPKAVQWLSEKVNDQFEKFKFNNIIASVGDFVLISTADAVESDTEEGCGVAQIESLYEDISNLEDPFRAKVQWYSRPNDLPKTIFNNMELPNFVKKEVLQDHRPFGKDISIETIYMKCTITLALTKDINAVPNDSPYHYLCRYRIIPITKRKIQIEPVLERERSALQFLCSPNKNVSTPNTPSSLIKRMNKVSISERDNWSISKNLGTKLLFKRDLLLDETKSPKKTKSISNAKTVTLGKNNDRNEIISMELKENEDEELPILIIRQHINTPERRSSVTRIDKETPRKKLLFNEEKTGSNKVIKSSKSSIGNRLSTLKRTPQYERICTPVTTPFKTPTTPSSARTNISQLTPSLQSRANPVDKIDDVIKDNTSLPGRETQMKEILTFIKRNLLDGTSRCMYICGMPGTGKTASVRLTLENLKKASGLPNFQLVEVNCMKISEPRQVFVQIYKQLTGKSVQWEKARSLLEKHFTKPSPRRLPTVMLVDELDVLCTRKQDVVHRIMEWASCDSAQLTVLAVANTMDLPERALANRVASRLGLTRLAFPPYTHTELRRIIETKLVNADITPDALQLIARKVAAVSGDVRRALALCTRALELAGPKAAGLKEVQRVLEETTSSPFVKAIRCCSQAETLILRAVAAEVERTGLEETTLSCVLSTAATIAAIDGRPYRSAVSSSAPTPSQTLDICKRLAAMRLLILTPTPAEPYILLNVSVDDIHYATKQVNES